MPFLLAQITDKPVTFNTTVGQIIAWIMIGLIAGLIANMFVRGQGYRIKKGEEG